MRKDNRRGGNKGGREEENELLFGLENFINISLNIVSTKLQFGK